ncbi:MAG: TetR/AcrR family transcriptional regulator [Pseudomonadales bacterium]
MTKTMTDNANNSKTKGRVRRSAPQARGQARREQLIEAAIALLEQREITEISLSDIAAHAGIPVGSSYHFFPNVTAIYSAVMIQYSYEIADFAMAVEGIKEGEQWVVLIESICDRIVEFYETHRAYEQIRLSGKTSADIKYNRQRKSGSEVAPMMVELIEKYFVLPEIPNRDRVTQNFLHIIDALYSYTFMEFGCINEQGSTEAKRAGIAYLKLYFPEYLPVR